MAKNNTAKKTSKREGSTRIGARYATHGEAPGTEGKRKGRGLRNFPPAYFLSLSLENVRCFGPNQTIDVSNGHGHPAQWTVILGDNNTGKTTLLQCFVALESSADSWDPFSSLEERRVTSFCPRFCLQSAEIRRSLFRAPEHAELRISGTVCVGARLRDARTPLQTTSVDVQCSDPACRGGKFVAEEYEEPVHGLLCYGYGASRVMGRASLSQAPGKFASESLFCVNATLLNAEEWLLQADYAAKSSPRSSLVGRTARNQREEIKDILVHLLPEVDDIRFTEPTKKDMKPRFEFKTPYGWVMLDALSLGYKTMIAWMIDLASRMFERYPKSTNPLAEPAVVLVDEIDLHLHPQWQRVIMKYLTSRFQNTQFIVTAHSPLIVQAASEGNVVLLKRDRDHVIIENNPQSVRGWRTDQILASDLFGIPPRSEEIEELRRERKRLLTKRKLSKADLRRLRQLESNMGHMHAVESPEEIEAMDIIRRAAKNLT